MGIEETIRRLKQNHTDRINTQDRILLTYLRYYGLPILAEGYALTWLRSTEMIAIQRFRPERPKGTVFLLHGYFDHVGTLAHAIQYFYDQGFAVISFDMPGHGLSGGKRAEIDHFSTYEQVCEDVMAMMHPFSASPSHLVAHSTGAAVTLGCVEREKFMFESVTLVSPLVRTPYFSAVRHGHRAIKPLKGGIRRAYGRKSSDPLFASKLKKDPLQHDKVPMSWVEAYLEWHDSFLEKEQCQLTPHVAIIQGTNDDTVDWRYNLKLLHEKYGIDDIVLINDGRHQLFNERMSPREVVFRLILRRINGRR